MAITTNQLEIKIAVVAKGVKDVSKNISDVKNSVEELTKSIKEMQEAEESTAAISKKAAQSEINASKIRISAMKEEAASAKLKNDMARQASREAKISADAVNIAAKAEADAMRIANQVAAEKERTMRIMAATRKREERETQEAMKRTSESGSLISSAFREIESVLRRAFAPITALNQGIQLASLAFGQMSNGMRAVLGPAIELQTAVAKINTLLTDTERKTFNAAKEIQKVQTLTGGSQADIAAGFYDILASGAVDAGKATEFMSAAQKLSIGGMTTVAESVKVLRSVMAAYGIEASKVTEISDALFIAARDGATDVQQLSQEMGASIGVASQLGVSYQELAAFASALTLTGVSTSEAFTSINSIMVAFARQTEEMSDRLKELGITSIQTEIATNGLVETIRRVFGDSSASSEGIIALTGRVEGFKAVSAATSESIGKSFDKIMGNIVSSAQAGGGATEKAFAEMSDTVEYQAKKTSSLVVAAFSIMGEGTAKAFTDVLKSINIAFTDLTPYVKGFSDALKEIDFKSLTTAATLAVAAIWAYNAANLSAILSTIKLGVTIAATSASTLTFSGALTLLSTSLWAVIAPIAVVVAKFALISAAVLAVVEVMSMLINNFDWLIDKITGGFRGIEFEGGAVSKTISSFFPAMDKFSESTEKAKDSLEEMKIKADAFRSSIKELIDNVAEADWSVMWEAGIPQPKREKEWSMLDNVDMTIPFNPDTEKAYEAIKSSIKGLRDEVDRLTLSEEDAVKALFRRKQAEIDAVEKSLRLEKKLSSERQAVIREARRLLYISESEQLADLGEKATAAQVELAISLAKIQNDRVAELNLTYKRDLSMWDKYLFDKKATYSQYEEAISALRKNLAKDTEEYVLKMATEGVEKRGSIVLKSMLEISKKIDDLMKNMTFRLPIDPNLSESEKAIFAKLKELFNKTGTELDKEAQTELDKEAQNWLDKEAQNWFAVDMLTSPFIQSMQGVLSIVKDSYASLKDLFSKGFINPDTVKNNMLIIGKLVDALKGETEKKFGEIFYPKVEQFKKDLMNMLKVDKKYAKDAERIWDELNKKISPLGMLQDISPEDFIKNYKKMIDSMKRLFKGAIPVELDLGLEQTGGTLSNLLSQIEMAKSATKKSLDEFNEILKVEMDVNVIALKNGMEDVNKYMKVMTTDFAQFIPMMIDTLITGGAKTEIAGWVAENSMLLVKSFGDLGDTVDKTWKTLIKWTIGTKTAEEQMASMANKATGLKAVFQKIGEVIAQIGRAFVSVLSGTMLTFGATMVQTVKALWYSFKTMLQAMLADSSVWTAILQYFNADKEQFKQTISTALESLLLLPERLAENIPTFIASVIAAIPPLIANIIKYIPSIIVNSISAVFAGLWKAGQDFLKNFSKLWVNTFARSIKALGDLLMAMFTGSLPKDTKDFIKGWFVPQSSADKKAQQEGQIPEDQKKPARFKAVGGAEFRVKDYENIAEASEATAFQLAVDKFDAQANVFGDVMDTSTASIMDSITDGFDDIFSSIKDVPQAIFDWGSRLWDGFKSGAEKVATWFLDKGEEIWDGFWGKFSIDANPTDWNAWVDAFVKVLTGPLDMLFGGLGSKAAEKIESASVSIGNSVESGSKSLVDAITSLDFEGVFVSLGDIISKWGSDLDKYIFQPILNFFNNLGTNFDKQITQPLKKAIQNAIYGIGDWLAAAFSVKPSKGTVEKWIDIDIPWIKFAQGGVVPGTAPVRGDSLANDKVPAMLSPGEIVIPRSIAMSSEYGNILQAILSGMPVVNAAFGWSDLDPTNKKGKLRQGVAELDPTDSNSALRKTVSGLTGTASDVYKWLKSIGSSVNYMDMVLDPIAEARRAFSEIARQWVKPQMLDIMKNVLQMAEGGIVPGRAAVPGDSYSNDRVLAMLSPGELVLPRTTVSDLMGRGQTPVGTGMVQNVTIEIRVEAGASVDTNTLRRELVPKVVDEIRRLSQNGTQIMSKRGVY